MELAPSPADVQIQRRVTMTSPPSMMMDLVSTIATAVQILQPSTTTQAPQSMMDRAIGMWDVRIQQPATMTQLSFTTTDHAFMIVMDALILRRLIIIRARR